MKILIIKYRNIGDVLLVTPLISNLKLFYPDAQIDFALNRGTEEMITLNPNVSEVLVYDRSQIKSLNLVNKIWKEFQFLSSFRNKNYQVVINLTEGDRGCLIAILTKAPVRIGYPSSNRLLKKAFSHTLPKQNFRHTIETNLDPLKSLKIPIKSKKVNLFWTDKDDEAIIRELNAIDNFIHIHPVSRWLFKCISDFTMSRIIDYCEIELGIKVVITSSSENLEIQKVNNILKDSKSKPLNLSGKLSLKETAALNKKAKLFIGVDTAIMHISASNNVPVLAFFGPSGANHWGPWDNNLMSSGYKNNSGFQVMGMHRVFSESRICQPCGKDGCSGSKISDCLMSLNLKKIKKNIMEMLYE